MVQRVVRLILKPLTLTRGLRDLVGRKTGSLSVGTTVDHVGDVIGLIEKDGLTEVLSMHHGGVGRGSVAAGTQPSQALLHGNSF